MYARSSPMRPLGLRVQIVVALAFLVAFATALTGFAIAQLSRHAVYESAEDAAEGTAQALAVVLSAGRAAGRPIGELEEVAVGALGRVGIDEIVLYDRRREEVLHVHKPGRRGSLRAVHPRALRPRTQHVENGIVVFAPSEDDSSAVAVHVSLDDAATRLANLDRLILFYAGVSALVLLLFALYAMTRLVLRPLEKIREAAERVATGELDAVVPVAGSRELTDFARSFNRMTENLRIHRSKLEGKVREVEARTEELRTTQSHLVRSEKLASVGRLAAGLAHEVGNPISAILGFCDLLESGATPEEGKDYVGRMKREAERVNRIVRDLLSYARPAIRTEDATDVAKVVEDATGLLWPQKGFRDVEIERVVAEGLPRVRISAESLGQVLVNLLLNAADAMGGKGQVRLQADAIEAWRRTPQDAASGAVRLIVADSGPGIPADRVSQVFDPFFTTKDPGKGTGLGLAICQSIVDTAGGRIEAGAAEGGGAKFTLHLPVVT